GKVLDSNIQSTEVYEIISNKDTKKKNTVDLSLKTLRDNKKRKIENSEEDNTEITCFKAEIRNDSKTRKIKRPRKESIDDLKTEIMDFPIAEKLEKTVEGSVEDPKDIPQNLLSDTPDENISSVATKSPSLEAREPNKSSEKILQN
ncbi:unnamed protein product, partial [Larinioides sclopetarius]